MKLLYHFIWIDLIFVLSIIVGIISYWKSGIKDEDTYEGKAFVKQQNFFILFNAVASLIYLIIKCWFVFSYHYLK